MPEVRQPLQEGQGLTRPSLAAAPHARAQPFPVYLGLIVVPPCPVWPTVGVCSPEIAEQSRTKRWSPLAGHLTQELRMVDIPSATDIVRSC
jgi:hypothetical protein